MSEHRVNVQWDRNGEDFNFESYNRDHTWTFEGGTKIKASAAPGFQGNPDCVDPEEALIGALSKLKFRRIGSSVFSVSVDMVTCTPSVLSPVRIHFLINGFKTRDWILHVVR